MPVRKIARFAIASGLAFGLTPSASRAAEYGYTTYTLGFHSFDAGTIPAPGVYVSDAVASYNASIDKLRVPGAPSDAKVSINLFENYTNLLYVPKTEVLGGHVGFSIATPAGYIIAGATPLDLTKASPAHTEGGGLADMIYQAQIGWEIGDFTHRAHLLIVAPTGRYELGFRPILGLNRPSFDLGWAFTWLDKDTGIQFNGGIGYMTSIENSATQYQTGDEFHVEWAIGKKFDSGLLIGIAGYNYRQVTGNSGPGALSPFVGQLDAVGVGLTYSTKIDDIPFTFAARTYDEYHSEHHFRGILSLAQVTAGF